MLPVSNALISRWNSQHTPGRMSRPKSLEMSSNGSPSVGAVMGS
jgi:hypothetical protein